MSPVYDLETVLPFILWTFFLIGFCLSYVLADIHYVSEIYTEALVCRLEIPRCGAVPVGVVGPDNFPDYDRDYIGLAGFSE
jgi:hypothetical protein